MRQQLSPGSSAKTLVHRTLWLGSLVGISATYACSLIVDRSETQCQDPSDCAGILTLTGSDVAACEKNLCVAVAGPGSSSSSTSGARSSSSSTSRTSSTAATTSSTTSSSSSGTTVVDAGCKAPANYLGFLNNLCTGTSCTPYDNAANIEWFMDAGADAALPSLPDASPSAPPPPPSDAGPDAATAVSTDAGPDASDAGVDASGEAPLDAGPDGSTSAPPPSDAGPVCIVHIVRRRWPRSLPNRR